MALSSPNDSNAEETLPQHGKPAAASVPELTASDSYQPDSIECFALLETSVPLEAPRMRYRVPPNPLATIPTAPPLAVQPSDRPAVQPQPDVAAAVVNEATIPLLEERLVVDRRRRKVGEVVVRKEIETYIVEVPVRREKLIVEQVSPNYEQLAVVDLGQTQAQTSRLSGDPLPPTLSAKFTSATAAIEFIEAIAAQSNSGLTSVEVNIAMVDEKLQTAYQQWLEQPAYQQWSEQHST